MIRQPQRQAARLQRLYSGDYDSPTAAPTVTHATAELLVFAGANVEEVSASISRHTLLLAPSDMALSHQTVGRAHVLRYETELADPSEELVFGDGMIVRRESYVTASFVPITCATAVAVTSEQDFDAFLADADAAVEEGVFEEALLHPAVILGDACGLGADIRCAAPQRSRMVLDAAGARPSFGGAPFRDAATETHGCTQCLARVVDGRRQVAERHARPWLPRYHRILDILRSLGDRRQAPIKVSGFGHRFVDGLTVEPLESPTAPVLLSNGDESLICDPVSRRVLQATEDVLRLIEIAQVGRGEVVDDVATFLKVGSTKAATALDQVQRTLDRLRFPLRVLETA